MAVFPCGKRFNNGLADGVIGDIRILMADFTHRSEDFDPSDRKFDKNLAGGALLDIGVYPLSLANFVFACPPIETLSSASIGEIGVDTIFVL